MSEDSRIRVGTRIKFLKALEEGNTEESPACIFAEKGDTGKIVSYTRMDTYLVAWDKWPNPFYAKSGSDFEVIEEDDDEDFICYFCGMDGCDCDML